MIFPMAGKDEGRARLKKDDRAEPDESGREALRGAVSLPFETGAPAHRSGERRRSEHRVVEDGGGGGPIGSAARTSMRQGTGVLPGSRATLVLAVKGQDSPQDQARRAALARWVDAVNAHGGFGTWSHALLTEPAGIRDVLDRNA